MTAAVLHAEAFVHLSYNLKYSPALKTLPPCKDYRTYGVCALSGKSLHVNVAIIREGQGARERKRERERERKSERAERRN